MKTFTRRYTRIMTEVDEGVILALWQSGYDTLEIARKLALKEWQVFNRLLHIRGEMRGKN